MSEVDKEELVVRHIMVMIMKYRSNHFSAQIYEALQSGEEQLVVPYT